MSTFDQAQLKAYTPKRVWNICKVMLSYYLSNITKRLWIAGYPAVLSIEPTNYCNLKCPQCPTGLGTLSRPQGYMQVDLFTSIIDAVADYVTFVQFFFQGEPFLHKNLLQMIRYVKDKNIYTITSTNGHFLSGETIDDIFKSGLDALIVGMDGVTPDVYGSYRQNGNFDAVVNGIKNLVTERTKRGLKHPKIYLQFIVLKGNENQVETAKAFGESLKADKILIKSAHIYPEMNPGDFLPENEKYSRYTWKNGKLTLKTEIPNRCRRIWTTAVFTWDGRLASCCFDKDAKHSFGTWNDSDFLNIWKSEISNRFRRQILLNRKKIPMCTNCTEGLKEFL